MRHAAAGDGGVGSNGAARAHGAGEGGQRGVLLPTCPGRQSRLQIPLPHQHPIAGPVKAVRGFAHPHPVSTAAHEKLMERKRNEDGKN